MEMPTRFFQLCQQQRVPYLHTRSQAPRDTATCPQQIAENSQGGPSRLMEAASSNALKCCHSSCRLLTRRHRGLLCTASSQLHSGQGRRKSFCAIRERGGPKVVLRDLLLQKATYDWEVTPRRVFCVNKWKEWGLQKQTKIVYKAVMK